MKLKLFIIRLLYITLAFAVIANSFSSCSLCKKFFNAEVEQIAGVVNYMTEIMVNNVTNPPLAARFFAYTMLAGYEAVSENDPSV